MSILSHYWLKIIALIDDPHELEECIVESEEFKDDIADKITHVQINIYRIGKEQISR